MSAPSRVDTPEQQPEPKPAWYEALPESSRVQIHRLLIRAEELGRGMQQEEIEKGCDAASAQPTENEEHPDDRTPEHLS